MLFSFPRVQDFHLDVRPPKDVEEYLWSADQQVTVEHILPLDLTPIIHSHISPNALHPQCCILCEDLCLLQNTQHLAEARCYVHITEILDAKAKLIVPYDFFDMTSGKELSSLHAVFASMGQHISLC